MHVFTSITANYLPKAATLAHSIKRVRPKPSSTLCISSRDPPRRPLDLVAGPASAIAQLIATGWDGARAIQRPLPNEIKINSRLADQPIGLDTIVAGGPD
jgi:hypothetical protein